MNGKKRIHILDYSKIFTALLVIYAHLYSVESETRLYIYSFHMPLFFIISGMFHKYENKININKYFKKIIIPAVFYILVFFVISFIFYELKIWESPYEGEWHERCFLEIKSSIIPLLRGKTMPNSVCWFLFALFWCKIICDIYIHKPYVLIATLLISFLFLRLIKISPFFLCQGIMSCPFYILGYKYKNNILKILKFKYIYFIIPFVLISTIMLTQINGRVSILGLIFGNTFFPLNCFIFYINAILGSALVFVISKVVRFNHSICERISESLLSILGFQKIITTSYIQFFGYDMPIIYPIISTFIIFITCYYLHFLVRKYFPIFVGATSLK